MKFYFRAEDVSVDLNGLDIDGTLTLVWKRGYRRTSTDPFEIKEVARAPVPICFRRQCPLRRVHVAALEPLCKPRHHHHRNELTSRKLPTPLQELSAIDGSLSRTAGTAQDLAQVCTMFKSSKSGSFESKVAKFTLEHTDGTKQGKRANTKLGFASLDLASYATAEMSSSRVELPFLNGRATLRMSLSSHWLKNLDADADSDGSSVASFCTDDQSTCASITDGNRPNLVPCFNLVLFASTTVCCAGRPAARYRAARGALPRVPTAFQGSKFVRGELKPRKYQVRARYQVRTNALLTREYAHSWVYPKVKIELGKRRARAA